MLIRTHNPNCNLEGKVDVEEGRTTMPPIAHEEHDEANNEEKGRIGISYARGTRGKHCGKQGARQRPKKEITNSWLRANVYVSDMARRESREGFRLGVVRGVDGSLAHHLACS